MTHTAALNPPKRALTLKPITLAAANAYILNFHRHSKPVPGHKWALSLIDHTNILRAVAITGRPVARELDDDWTIEILRLCTDGTPNACSQLYAACCRTAAAMGYRRIITYTLSRETGASLRAAAFLPAATVTDRQWNTPSRPRAERELIGDKIRWQRTLRTSPPHRTTP